MKADELRKQFMSEGLARAELDPSPFITFEGWYRQTIDSDIPEPTAMCLATVDSEGQPWQRMVLLKLFDENGFVFFTNYSSRKAGHIEQHNKVSLLFPWHALGRQVKITGSAVKVSTSESMKYFLTRPRGSQIGAWASPQSKVITSRAMLDAKVAEMKEKFARGEVPLPSHWGGYRIKPLTIEFWQARDDRLHDRFIYRYLDNEWMIERLAP
ncbi:MAG: pyridoxamine 5'-phosphate oxidase [Thioalkalispiraceae bacterium]|jgi:pyridoxamine 5'-phosphate oxidase